MAIDDDRNAEPALRFLDQSEKCAVIGTVKKCKPVLGFASAVESFARHKSLHRRVRCAE